MSSTANGIERHLATGETYQTALDGLHEAVFVKDLAHRWVACNDAFCNLFGATREKIIGYSDPDFFPPAEAQEFWRGDDIIFETRQPFVQDEQMTLSSGQTVHISTRKYPRFDPAGNLIGLVGIIIDYTEIHKRREQADQLLLALEERQHTIEQQRQLIEQVSVPVIQVWEHILLLPLIGTVDDNRAVRVIESSLEAIARTGAEVLLIDITGVPMVDTAVAAHLVQMIRAAQLLGCRSILVGVSSEIARTLVQLGVDFSNIETLASLQVGLAHALRQRDLAVGRA